MRSSNSVLDFSKLTSTLSLLLVEGGSSSAQAVSTGMRGRVQATMTHYRPQIKKDDPHRRSSRDTASFSS
jgi:hypothetical protein